MRAECRRALRILGLCLITMKLSPRVGMNPFARRTAHGGELILVVPPPSLRQGIPICCQ